MSRRLLLFINDDMLSYTMLCVVLCYRQINGNINDYYNPANFLFGCPGGQYQPDHSLSSLIANLFYDCSPTLSEYLGLILRSIGSLYCMFRNIVLLVLGILSMVSFGVPAMILIGTIISIYKRKLQQELIFKIIPICSAFVFPGLFSVVIDIPCALAMLPLAIIGAWLKPGPRKNKIRAFTQCLESVSYVMFLVHLFH